MKQITGKLFQRTPGGKWYLRYTVNKKTTNVSTGTANRRKAEAEQKRILAPFLLQSQGERLQAVKARLDDTETQLAIIEQEKNPPLLLRDAWRTFEESSKRKKTGAGTLGNYENHWKQFKQWLADNHPETVFVRDVGTEIAEEYTRHLLRVRNLTGNTFNKHVRLLDYLFRMVQDKAKWTINPWASANIAREEQNPQSRRELTVAELWKVCTEATGELRLMLAIGIYTGLRRGDCATLRWSEVDLIRGQVQRIPSKTGRKKPVPVTIGLHPTLAAMLAEIPLQDRGEYILPGIAERYHNDERELTRDIQDHFENCGIRTHKPGTGVVRVQKKGQKKYESTGKRAVVEVGFHSLRHSFVSLCRSGDVPLSVVEKLVGHSNPAMTRHYTHVSDADSQKAMLCLPDVLADQSTQTPVPEASNDSGAILKAIRAIAEGIKPGADAEAIKAAMLAALEGGAA